MTLRQISSKAKRALRRVEDGQVAEEDFVRDLYEFLTDSTATTLAIAIGYTPQYLSDVRHGRRRVTAEFLKRISNLERNGA